jgi:hypothetical protein
MKKQYDIKVSDMNREPIELYRLGVTIGNKGRGNTAGRTKKTTEDEDEEEDNQEKCRPKKKQKTNNRKSDNENTEETGHNENTKKTGETQIEEQDEENVESSGQEEENKTTEETAEILKDIICKNLKKHMQTITRCTPKVITLANELSPDLTEFVTNQRPTECSIEMQDIEDRQTRTSKRTKK